MLEMHLRQLLPKGAQYTKIETIQSLWSGYGEIARYAIDDLHMPHLANSNDASINSKQLPPTLIVKYIHPPTTSVHPKGWNTSTSHRRKLSSYVNEWQFYRWYAEIANDVNLAVSSTYSKVPQYYGGYCPDKAHQNFNACLLMEDLDAVGFVGRANMIDKPVANHSTIMAGITWLANFHAVFLQHEITKVWKIGTYWHLATRPDEWKAMPESALKHAASRIDKTLNAAKYQTLVHGDAKLANFCFKVSTDHSEPQLAAVDFQYVGQGAGTKDLVYFLGSCLYHDDLARYFSGYVDAYFAALSTSLENLKPSNIDVNALEQEWRALIPFAFADFERFLIGWSPRHAKLCAFSAEQTVSALQQL